MSHRPESIPAAKFKLRCLSLLDKVARTRQPLIVTKRGKPVAKVVPTETRKAGKLLGSVKFHGNVVVRYWMSGKSSTDLARHARLTLVTT